MELFWISDVIAVATRPRGGDWLRDDLAAAQIRSVRIVVSCLTKEEESDLGLEAESEEARSLGMDFVRVAIADQGVPQQGVVEEALSSIGERQDRTARWLSTAGKGLDGRRSSQGRCSCEPD